MVCVVMLSDVWCVFKNLFGMGGFVVLFVLEGVFV